MHLFPSALSRILKHELIIEELYCVLLEVTAWSGQVHLKLTSRTGNFSLSCKGELFDYWCTNVPTDPCSAEALITRFLHHPLLSPFSYGRQAWERSVRFRFHSRDAHRSALKILSFFIALFPLATPAVGSFLHKPLCKFKQAVHLQFSSETRTQTCGNVTLASIFSVFWLLPEKNAM